MCNCPKRAFKKGDQSYLFVLDALRRRTEIQATRRGITSRTAPRHRPTGSQHREEIRWQNPNSRNRDMQTVNNLHTSTTNNIPQPAVALAAVVICAVLIALLFLTSCSASKAAQPKQPSPATVENAKPETALATVKLTPRSRETARHSNRHRWQRADVARTIELSGEVVMPQGQTDDRLAPMAGTLQAATKSAAACRNRLLSQGPGVVSDHALSLRPNAICVCNSSAKWPR